MEFRVPLWQNHATPHPQDQRDDSNTDSGSRQQTQDKLLKFHCD
jgi:hypothetical protein